jgi:hypothetical protein
MLGDSSVTPRLRPADSSAHCQGFVGSMGAWLVAGMAPFIMTNFFLM